MPVFHFSVTIGSSKGGFSEVSGLHLEYGDMKMPGLPKVSDVTLRKGIMDANNTFFDWLHQVKRHIPEREDVFISLLNEEHKPVMTWKLEKAWPIKMEGPGFKGDSNEIVLEKLVLAYERLTVDS